MILTTVEQFKIVWSHIQDYCKFGSEYALKNSDLDMAEKIPHTSTSNILQKFGSGAGWNTQSAAIWGLHSQLLLLGQGALHISHRASFLLIVGCIYPQTKVLSLNFDHHFTLLKHEGISNVCSRLSIETWTVCSFMKFLTVVTLEEPR